MRTPAPLGLIFALLAIVIAPAAPTAAQLTAPTPPTLPDPVAVTLNPQTTALLVLDLNVPLCAPRPDCAAMIPSVAGLLAAARSAGATVVFSSTPAPGSPSGAPIVPDLAPQPGEPIVVSHADKFFETPLADILSNAGVDTVVIVGFSANGAVMYTSFGANERGITVVVPEDGMAAADPFATFVTGYQLLNEPGYSNLANTPLTANAVTLSRTDLISFAPGM